MPDTKTGKIRIVQIITKLELGGAQEATLSTVENLDRSRFEPVLISGQHGLLVQKARSLKGVKCIFVPALHRQVHPVWDFLALVHLILILHREKMENPRIIVHTNSSKAGILGRMAAAAAGIGCIVHTVHGFGFHDYQRPLARKLYIFLEKAAARVSTRIIFVSRANLKLAQKLGICRRIGHGRVIRCGIDLHRFFRDRDQVMQEQGAMKEDSSPLIGMVACFKPQKSPLDFIRMAERVSRVFPKARFMMVGDGQLRPQIRSLAQRLSLSDRLVLAGWREDVERILPELDVLVLTSLWEGLPLVLVEATAAGIPIVATDIDGNREIVRNGINGYVVPPRNPAAMAERVISALQHPEQLAYTGKAQRFLVQGFDLHHMIRQLELLYQEIMPMD
ncbi:MAG: glycosyltransferase family 4 protein [bacterium]